MWGVIAGYLYGRKRERDALERDATVIVVKNKPEPERPVNKGLITIGMAVTIFLFVWGVILRAPPAPPLSRAEAQAAVLEESTEPVASKIPCGKDDKGMVCYASDTLYDCRTYLVRKDGYRVFVARIINSCPEGHDA